MTRIPIKPTNENFDKYAEPVLARWLIEAAMNRTDITYGEAMLRLEQQVGFSSIGRATRLGYCAGQIIHNIQANFPDPPLLNALLVLQEDHMPSTGAGSFLAAHFNQPRLASQGFRDSKPAIWREYFESAAEEVYAFPDWPRVYRKVYGTPYKPDTSKMSPSSPTGGAEKDGIARGRGGEGPNHKALRLWVKANPAAVFPRLQVTRTDTEIDLLSGDRVDVVYYAPERTIALEVKSKDSNEADLTRGIYQCVKYRAVMQAMDPRDDADIWAVLVTEQKLPGYLKELAKRLEVPHKLVSPKKAT
ncbi:hypothetical protein [Paracoccus sanguinis]|uniref:Uncharacterized protein n=1 Tax=Paracoccus sanguinis TaxID=1545044 RepID=A0A1H2T539_9RHOB|nr:hypothetical protein [Paracoccus sanguinis]SDW38897.1 hypothetical protein SAMN05444276_101844 [Paracoccus sanguinis]